MNVRTAAVRILAASLILFLALAWVQTLRHSGEDPTVLDRDWVAFHRAGALLRQGCIRDIYPQSFDTGYPFLYPPYFVYACAPLGLLPSTWAYAACVAGALVMLAASLWVLKAWVPGKHGEYATATLVILASGPWNGIIAVGQFSSLFVLILAAGFLEWRRGKVLTAGVILSLLAIKPNLGAIIALIAFAKGGWRMAGGLTIGVAALVVSTLPLGAGVWEDYLAASARMAEEVRGSALDMWKHQTLYAFWCTTLRPSTPATWVHLVWGASVAPMAIGALLAWRGRLTPQRLPRLLGVTVLLVVGCNPYVYFYDGLLLMIPGVVWYVERGRYAGVRCHRICGICLAAIFVWQHLSLFVLKEKAAWALVGVGVLVWFLAEVYDLIFASRVEKSDKDRAVVP